MEAVQKRPAPSESLKKWLSTRRGTWTLAALSAALAGVVLFVYLNQYKSDVKASVAPTPVLVADRFIPRGSSGSEVAIEKFFRPAAVPQEDVAPGAITQASQIAGLVAVRPILPGQQITAADFAAVGDPIRSRIQGVERAVQIPLDATRGLGGVIGVGDRVDILATFNAANGGEGTGTPALEPLMRNVRIMALNGGNVILQATDQDAARIAWTVDNAKLWFLLRPPVGAKDSRPISVTRSSLTPGRPIDISARIRELEKRTGKATP